MIARYDITIDDSGYTQKVFRIDSVEIVENINKELPLKIPYPMVKSKWGDPDEPPKTIVYDLLKVDQMVTINGYIDRTSVLRWDEGSAYSPPDSGSLFTYAHEALNDLKGVMTGGVIANKDMSGKSLVGSLYLLPDSTYSWDLGSPQNDEWTSWSSSDEILAWENCAYLTKMQANTRTDCLDREGGNGFARFYDVKLVFIKAEEY